MHTNDKNTGALRIIAGGTYSAAAVAAIREIDPSRRTIVIVPDRYTLQTEKLVLKTLNLKGSFNISVNSFDRLFYRLCGRADAMPAASAVMLLQKIISENAKQLKCFYRSAGFQGFAEKAYGVITRLKSGGVTPQALRERAETGDGALGRKLKDVCFLFEKYETEAKGFLDLNDRARELRRIIAEGRAGECDVVLLGFDNMTRLEYGIVRQFLLSGCPVTAAVTYREKHNSYNNELYEGLTAAAHGRQSPEIINVPSAPKSPVFRHLFNNLNQYPFQRVELKNNTLTVYEAADIVSEVRKTAEMIAVYTRRGYRFNEIAVICPEPESYISAVERIFPQYNIGFFSSAPQTLDLHPLFSYIVAGVEARLKGCALNDILVFIKNPYFNMYGVADGDKSIFENYCLRCGVNRNGFFNEFTYGADAGERAAAEGVRKKLIAALKAFEGLETGADCAAFIDRLLLLSEPVTARLAAAAEYRTAELLRQGGDGFKAVGAEIARIFGGAKVPPKLFRDVLRRGASLYELSAIPETQDCVVIGEPGLTRVCPPKILFIWNACEGGLPAETPDSGLINDADIASLHKGGVEYEPSALRANIRANAEIYQAVISPLNALHISYPASGADGKPKEPARLIGEINRLFTRNGLPLAPYNENYDVFNLESAAAADRKKAARLAADIYACTEQTALRSLSVLTGVYAASGNDGGADLGALYASLSGRGKLAGGRVPEPYRQRLETIAGADDLFFYRNAAKVSQIESFYACPYAHFLEYGARLKERKEAEPDGANIGTILHAVLERFMKGGMARGGAEIFDEVISEPEYAPAKNSPDTAPVFRRLRRESQKVCEVLKEQQAFSEFVPTYFEYDFMKENNCVAFNVRGRQIRLSGKIDRVDILEKDGRKYARVIDYKSGAGEEKLTYSKLSRGENIQLLVYLAYMRAAGYAPAGAFYFKVHNAGDGYRMGGAVCGGNELPRMMDNRLQECGFKSDIINVSTTAKGAYVKNPYTVDEGELNALCDYALEKMGEACERISGGECPAFPLPDACGFCRYGNICGFDADKDDVREDGKSFRTAEELLNGQRNVKRET